MESPLAISNFFIKEANLKSIELTPMKLLKLVYLAHAWHLGLYNEPLIDEPVYAWKYGPVVTSVYYEFRDYHNSQITSPTKLPFSMIVPFPTDEKTPFLTKIWTLYKDYNGVQLSSMTHKVGTPWYNVWVNENGKNRLSAVIPNSLIQEYYQSKINQTATS